LVCKQNRNHKIERTRGRTVARMNAVTIVGGNTKNAATVRMCDNTLQYDYTERSWQLHSFHSDVHRLTAIYTTLIRLDTQLQFRSADAGARSGNRLAVGMRGCDVFRSTWRWQFNLNLNQWLHFSFWEGRVAKL